MSNASSHLSEKQAAQLAVTCDLLDRCHCLSHDLQVKKCNNIKCSAPVLMHEMHSKLIHTCVLST